MSTFYKTGGYVGDLVIPVDVEKYTKFTVWIRGRQHRRTTSYERYWPTEASAWDYLIGVAEKNLEYADDSVEWATQKLDAVLNARAREETNH